MNPAARTTACRWRQCSSLLLSSPPFTFRHCHRLTSAHFQEDTRDPHINALLASTDSPEILSIKLIEGRNRQIRRMTESVGLFVRGLRRIEFAGISLEGLSEGEWKDLSADEVKLLNSAMRRRVEE